MKTHDWRSERAGRLLRFEGTVAAVRSSPGDGTGKGFRGVLLGGGDIESRASGRLGGAEKGLED